MSLRVFFHIILSRNVPELRWMVRFFNYFNLHFDSCCLGQEKKPSVVIVARKFLLLLDDPVEARSPPLPLKARGSSRVITAIKSPGLPVLSDSQPTHYKLVDALTSPIMGFDSTSKRAFSRGYEVCSFVPACALVKFLAEL
jgi:hypothetical protein